jgi:hypothetical protein
VLREGVKIKKGDFYFLCTKWRNWQVGTLCCLHLSVTYRTWNLITKYCWFGMKWTEKMSISQKIFNFYKYILFLVYFSGDGRTIKIFMSQNDSERSPSRETPYRLLPSPSVPAQLRNMNGYQSSHRGSKILVCKFI